MAPRLSPLVLAALLTLIPLGGCGPTYVDLVQRLSDQEKDLLNKYKQFMTDNQQARYLSLSSYDERLAFTKSLHVEERLATFPPYIAEAIWENRVVTGMTVEALILSWGTPTEVFRNYDGGVRREQWFYTKADPLTSKVSNKMVIVNEGVVLEVKEP